MSVAAYLALGSNVGDRRARLDAAVAALSATPGVTLLAVSPYHETAPVGGPSGQGPFLNAAAAVATSLPPLDLLASLQSIESAAGRLRTIRWGERTLDLDLILFGDAVIDAPELQVPHPRFAVRRFVLAPLAQIAPRALDPLTRRTAAELLANLDRRPSFVVLLGPDCPGLFRRVSEGLSAIGLFDGAGPHVVDCSTILEQKAGELDADRWSSEAWGDRWMISDFWFDRLARDTRMEPGSMTRWEQRLREVRGRIIRPTFVFATHRESFRELRRWAAENPGTTIGGRDVPLLGPAHDDSPTPDSTRLDAIASEILAACAATRP